MSTFPARRSPDGYVAQRILDNGPDGEHHGARGPWLLTFLNEFHIVAVQVLTDDEVADWPPLHDVPPPCAGCSSPLCPDCASGRRP